VTIISPSDGDVFPVDDPDAPDPGATVTLEADIEDSDTAQDQLRIRWFSDTQGLLGTGNPLTTFISTGGADVLAVKIRVMVFDGPPDGPARDSVEIAVVIQSQVDP
jgi:hypothetical protein